MKWFFVLLSGVFIVGTTAAQTSHTLPKGVRFFTIPPNEYWHAQPWSRDSLNLFPEFQESKLEFNNGFTPTSQLLMNYNLFTEKFLVKESEEHITPFEFTNEVKYIWIGDHKFIHSKQFGYLEVIMQGRVSVAVNTFVNVIVDPNSMQRYPLSLSDNRMGVAKTTRYYYVDQKYYIFADPSYIYRSSPAALPKIFPKEKRTIRDFEKNQHTNYSKREDVLKIALFCNREL